MATYCSINQLHTFLSNPDQQRLVIQFSTLHIKTFQHEECLQNILLPDRRLRFVKTQDPKKLRVQVLDNLVFRFSFVFSAEALHSGEKACARKLPRPLEKVGYVFKTARCNWVSGLMGRTRTSGFMWSRYILVEPLKRKPRQLCRGLKLKIILII